MSEKYLPLFRKYRPQSFKDVVGQESLTKALSNAIELNKIANAYLFAGPRGTGKTSTARIFAKSLNCVNGPTLEPCQKCPSCLDITNASGLDVIEIDAATNRGIDDAKELIAQAQYAPMNGKYKIFIIDEVHMLSNEAFNALLKTFEEPPQNVIFILATTEPHKVIETIISRCQRFDLRRITTDDITKRLREIADLENIKITDDALYAIAKNVSGGLRDSLALLDQVSILGAKEEITKEVIENLLGKMTFDVSVNFLEKILSKDTQSAVSYIDEIYNKGLEPKNFCENFIEFLRNLIFALSSADDKNTLKFTNFNTCDIEKIKSLKLDSTEVFRILNKVIEYYKEIRFATNPYLWVELMIINLCKMDEVIALQRVMPASDVQNIPVQNIQPVQNVPAESQKYTEKPQMQAIKQTGKIENTEQMQSAKPAETRIEPSEAVQSVVKETLKEIDIPENEIVKEQPKNNEPEHLMEYKENLYEEKQADDKAEMKSAAAISDTPSLPKVPGVDDVPVVQNVLDGSSNPAAENAPNAKAAQKANPAGGQENSEINPAAAWAKVLNAIELIPAKFFFSSRKLLSIKDKKITLGFVNEKLIEQAKSDSKYKHLDKAVKSVLGADYIIEFIIMMPDMKPIDVKLNTKIQSPQPARVYQNPAPVSKPSMPQMSAPSMGPDISKEDLEKEFLMDMNPPKAESAPENTMAEKTPVFENSETPSNKASSVSHYGKKTQEMLEAFNGKVIE